MFVTIYPVLIVWLVLNLRLCDAMRGDLGDMSLVVLVMVMVVDGGSECTRIFDL